MDNKGKKIKRSINDQNAKYMGIDKILDPKKKLSSDIAVDFKRKPKPPVPTGYEPPEEQTLEGAYRIWEHIFKKGLRSKAFEMGMQYEDLLWYYENMPLEEDQTDS